MHHSTALFDILILLAAAAFFGTVFERFRQSSILGYLVAGTVFGSWVTHADTVNTLAELGVALLLFTIGLEFSWRRLRGLGAVALGGGVLQIGVTLAVVAAISLAFGVDSRGAIALGCIVALSSTACVLRIFSQRAELDSVHGRTAMGILLMQDLSLVPLVLIVTNLAGGTGWVDIAVTVGGALCLALGLVVAFLVIRDAVVARFLHASAGSSNRELPILLATVICLASAWGAHELGLSPALGAFAAGVMLAETPFATQIRADVGVLKTLFVTIFFTSIGMLADPSWILENAGAVVLAVAAAIVIKSAIVAGILRAFRVPFGTALAAGVCVAQVGEFSFVLAAIADKGGVFGPYVYNLVIATTLFTLFLTPFLVALGSRLAARSWPAEVKPGEADESLNDHVVVVGYGPAGRRVVGALREAGCTETLVLELNPQGVKRARAEGIRAELGDATQPEVLEHLAVGRARAVVITVPDQRASQQAIAQVRVLAPQTRVIARARFESHRGELLDTGADVVLDEEREVGRVLGVAVVRSLGFAAEDEAVTADPPSPSSAEIPIDVVAAQAIANRGGDEPVSEAAASEDATSTDATSTDEETTESIA